MSTERRGTVVLFGSGETAAVGRDALRWLVESGRPPRRIAVLETPAGFEPNADAVARRWTDFFERQDAASGAEVLQLPLRRRGPSLGADDPAAASPLLGADLVALGAGSPTYTVRHLKDSLAWRYLFATHLHGASLFLASAAAVAAGTFALPVYEIYKVGEDPHWTSGLGLFEPYGLSLAVVPHWDNSDGGEAVDTSRCYVGADRFDALVSLLPGDAAVLGVGEHTALALDLDSAVAHVLGRGGVTVLRDGTAALHTAGATFPLSELGPFAAPPPGLVPEELMRRIAAARSGPVAPRPPADIAELLAERERARERREWPAADRLRRRIAELGWSVEDAPDGPQVRPLR